MKLPPRYVVKFLDGTYVADGRVGMRSKEQKYAVAPLAQERSRRWPEEAARRMAPMPGRPFKPSPNREIRGVLPARSEYRLQANLRGGGRAQGAVTEQTRDAWRRQRAVPRPRDPHGIDLRTETQNSAQVREETQILGSCATQSSGACSTIAVMPGELHYGDNLDIMRRLASKSIDLVYLDPPFNSDETYGLLYKGSQAQQDAFWDSWHWNTQAQETYAALVDGGHGIPRDLSEMMIAMKAYLYPNHKDMLAYITMLAIRLVEMKRVLRDTGSLYLHCDPTASHYIKLVLDLIFTPECYRNEIAWLRTNSHNYKSKNYPRVTDTIFFYTRSGEYRWNHPKSDTYSAAQMKRFKVEPGTGRLYKGENLTMGRAGKDRQVTWRGATPKAGRGWGMSLEERERLWAEGRILTKRDGVTPRLDGWKIYLDETAGGKEVSNFWDDIPRLANKTDERTGYATQKPVPLLKRIIEASSDPGDIVLDPFCGCGTTIEAAEEISRKWIGIDIAIRAVDVMKDRLDAKFGRRIWTEHGEPKDIEQAERLAKNGYDFQWWAVRMLGGSPPDGIKKKGADDGRDGELSLIDDSGTRRRGLISVKGGENNQKDYVKLLHENVREKKYDFGILAMMYDPTQPMRDQAADYGSVLWAGAYKGKTAHKIRIITAAEWLPPHEVRWPGKIDRPRSQSAPPPPEARPGDTLHLPFAPRVPAKAKMRKDPPPKILQPAKGKTLRKGVSNG